MTELPLIPNKPSVNKARKPAPPERIRGKCSLIEFRALLDKIVGHPELFSDDQIRWAGEVLHAGSQDVEGTVRISWTPGSRVSTKRFKFSRDLRVSGEMPGDDAIRQLSREIALIQDETVALQSIDGLSQEFLRRAAILYGFKADSAIGLKSAFANVVNDIRQMENIAASGNKGKETPSVE